MHNRAETHETAQADVLIVGAGPTGLTLAAQLRTFGVRFRLIDRAFDRAHESRALAVQARSLEVFQSLGLADTLTARGNRSARVTIDIEGRVAADVHLAGFDRADTRYPYILFVSQAETEAVLASHLSSHGVTIERGLELTGFAQDESTVECILRHRDGREERVRTSYLVGCDGAHSAVRKGAGISFQGDAYLQDFMLGDVEAEPTRGGPLRSDSLHSFVGRDGIAMFFPLGHPSTWRIIAMSASTAAASRRLHRPTEEPVAGDLSIAELQAVVDGATGGGVRVRDPAWLSHFRLHHRQAVHYSRGRVFLAGDAGHIHSPVGAQGMNTGIQDAWNLGWKLALVARGAAETRLLESYEAERWPVGRTLLRYTDRVFSVFVRSMSGGALASWLRRNVPARVLPAVLRSKRARTFAFRFISELDIHYRKSPAVREGSPRLPGGPRAGDRLPDGPVSRHGRPTNLHDEMRGPVFHLLLCGPLATWNPAQVTELTEQYQGLVSACVLSREAAPGTLLDSEGQALKELAVRDAGQYLVRPDGHIAFRCAGSDLTCVRQYLESWLVPRSTRSYLTKLATIRKLRESVAALQARNRF